jgi:hemerythrin
MQQLGRDDNMKIIEWMQEMSVHVTEIDVQHKKLVAIVNAAFSIENPNENRKEFEPILNDLIEFTRVHFSTEEKYFEKFNYAEKDEHIAEHLKLMDDVLKFKDGFDSGKCDCEPFLSFLRDWLAEHLLKMDQKYIECFKANGLE